MFLSATLGLLTLLLLVGLVAHVIRVSPDS